jgi:hypothetical protein
MGFQTRAKPLKKNGSMPFQVGSVKFGLLERPEACALERVSEGEIARLKRHAEK